MVAIWDEDIWNEDTGAWGAWIELPSVVDTENNTITATVDHFTIFAITAVPEGEAVEAGEGVSWWCVWLIAGLASAAVVGLLIYLRWWRRRAD